VTKAFLITRPPPLRFGKIERPTFDEIPDAQPAAAFNITAGDALALAFVNDWLVAIESSNRLKRCGKLIVVMALRVMRCLLRSCCPRQT
jgi:hypothetical protein